MSINVANTAPGIVVVTAGIAVAQRLMQGEWSWTWVAYFWGCIFAFAIVGSALAGIVAGIRYLLSGDKRAREARLVQYEATHVYVLKPDRYPQGVGRLTFVPKLARIEIDLDSAADPVREQIVDAVERLKRDVAPDAWIGKLTELLSSLRDTGFELREPVGGFYWHDPDPTASPPPPRTSWRCRWLPDKRR